MTMSFINGRSDQTQWIRQLFSGNSIYGMRHSTHKISVICIVISLMISTGCSVVHKTWLSESEITEILVLDPVYDPNQHVSYDPKQFWLREPKTSEIGVLDSVYDSNQHDFYYSKQLQDIVYQMARASSEKSIRIINADWLINHQKIFEIWTILDQSQQAESLNFDNELLYEQLEPFEIIKKDRILMLRIGLDDSDEKALILDGYRLVKVDEAAVDINYFKTPLSVKDISSSIQTAVSNLLFSMKYSSPGFSSLGFEKVPGGCYQNRQEEEVCLKDYYISRYPVTEKQWHLIMDQKDADKAKNQTDREIRPLFPKTNVTWNQIQLFLERLNDVAKGNYFLPTVSDWEYACLKLEKNSQGNFLGKQGSDQWLSIAPVNAFPMGQTSIADLKGNTWEWTSDTYSDPSKNPVFQWLDALGKPASMVLKGGSFDSPASSNNCLMEMKLRPNRSIIDTAFRLIWEP